MWNPGLVSVRLPASERAASFARPLGEGYAAKVSVGSPRMRTFTRVIVGAAALLSSLLLTVPASAQQAPADPQTVDELRDFIAYRSDHGDVLRLYRAFFDREPDIAGASYWIDVYDNGASLDDLAWGFAQSEEFRLTYGSSVSDEQFLTLLYRNMLGRSPDPSGFAYWLDQMANGLSQSGVVRWVVANQEFINNYPYPDLRPDVSTIVLSLDDLEAGWVHESRSVDDEEPGCPDLFALPARASGASFVQDETYGPFVAQFVHSFPTTALAEKYVSDLRALAPACSSFTYDEFQVTVAEMSYNDYADDVAAYQVRFDADLFSANQHYVVVRYGSTIIATTRLALFFSVYTWETEPLVELTLERLVDLAG